MVDWRHADPIQSQANPAIKRVRSLQRRKVRETERAFVVEGRRAVGDALAAGAVPQLLLVREGDEELVGALPHSAAAPVRRVSPAAFDPLSETATPQGVLAVFPFPDVPLPRSETPLLLVADGVRDPGNLGTLVRAAAGAGVTAVYLTAGTVDPFHPKVVRGAMGAHFRVPIRWLDGGAVEEVVARCPVRVVADARAGRSYDEVDWSGPAALVVGSEAEGAGGTTRALATDAVRIPLASAVESLNVAVAGAVILFEAARQRRVAVGAGRRP
jgi:RNA methyltransferase, TrmH family